VALPRVFLARLGTCCGRIWPARGLGPAPHAPLARCVAGDGGWLRVTGPCLGVRCARSSVWALGLLGRAGGLPSRALAVLPRPVLHAQPRVVVAVGLSAAAWCQDCWGLAARVPTAAGAVVADAAGWPASFGEHLGENSARFLRAGDSGAATSSAFLKAPSLFMLVGPGQG
jgi:hypothetical protein